MMNKVRIFNKIFAVLFSVSTFSLTSCRKEAFDSFYGRPDSLAQPIYQVLKSKGNFKNYLQLVDRADYKTVLSGQGYWTAFVPNDDAFSSYLQKKGVSDTKNIDSATASQIVRFSLVYNAFGTDYISDYQSNAGWVANSAYKRRTAYYDFVYTDTVDGTILKVIASNRNGSYVSTDNGNKYIPYFTSAYASTNLLSAADYSYFFPNATYNGFNVVNARVVESDEPAENGVIHTLDQVIEPLGNIEQYLAAHSEYSEFKRLIDKFFVTYTYNEDASKRYNILSGTSDRVYAKNYSSTLGFALNNENYLKQEDNDGQKQGWTLFVPTNDVLLKYEKEYLLKYYPGKKIDDLSINVITNLINAHMWQTTVWPSKFGSTFSVLGEEVRQSKSSSIIDKQVLSNGFFYGVNQVQKANIFHSVYSVPFLNPDYTLYTRLLDQELYLALQNPNLRFVVFVTSDNVLNNIGYAWNTTNSTFQYTSSSSAVTIGGTALSTLKAAANNQTVYTSGYSDVDFSGKGILETYDGQYIKYDNNKIYSSGTLDNTDASKQYVSIDSVADEKSNGVAYFINGLLTTSSLYIGSHILQHALTATEPFYNYYQYLKNSVLYTASTGQITGISASSFYTLLVPSNKAVLEAVKEGYLPGTVSNGIVTPNYTPSTSGEIELVSKFIQYHIIDKNTIVPDGRKNGTYTTLLKDLDGNAVTVKVSNSVDVMSITDYSGFQSNVILDDSNVLSGYAVIHSIDNFLHYN